ncbi:MAG: S41 family peptidase [Phycisphaerales bacterium]|nr:MAG: S41 family peptidase [Phycisphaerales bacterium]
MKIKRTVAPILLAVLAGAMLVQLPFAIADRSSVYEWFSPVIDVRDILLKRYVTEPDQKKMQQAVIEGMVNSLDDPYTTFIPPSRRADLDRELRGTYVGIGAEVNIVDGYLTIISPMDGSPALEAGIMAGDVVLEIEGESTYGKSIDDAIQRLLGEPNTQVTLKIRQADGTEVERVVTRRQIVTRTVRGLRRHGEAWNYCVDDEHNIAYLRITQFTGSTAQDIYATLSEVGMKEIGGLVLDVRDNPGGSLDAAVDVANLFLNVGTIASVRDRQGKGRTYEAERNGTLPNFPMVVLVNGASASASEIIAGALQENDRAKVLGTRTFGKASVQELRELPFNHGTLKFTVAHYHLPSGRNLNRLADSEVWGVDPDPGFVVPVSDRDYMEMLRSRREYEVIREAEGDDPGCANVNWIKHDLKDVQLARAVEALRARAAGQDWPVEDETDPTQLAFGQELSRAMSERGRLMERIDQIEERIREMQGLADRAGRERLVPEDIDVAGGQLTLRDSDGNVIGEYKIRGGDVEAALRALQAERRTEG